MNPPLIEYIIGEYVIGGELILFLYEDFRNNNHIFIYESHSYPYNTYINGGGGKYKLKTYMC